MQRYTHSTGQSASATGMTPKLTNSVAWVYFWVKCHSVKKCSFFVKPECSALHYHTTFGVLSHSHVSGSFLRITHCNILELSLRNFVELGEITIGPTTVIPLYFGRVELWSNSQSSWLQIQRPRVRFPALPDFLSSGSGTVSTQPREYN
jgi:hypothetical protein